MFAFQSLFNISAEVHLVVCFLSNKCMDESQKDGASQVRHLSSLKTTWC